MTKDMRCYREVFLKTEDASALKIQSPIDNYVINPLSEQLHINYKSTLRCQNLKCEMCSSSLPSTRIRPYFGMVRYTWCLGHIIYEIRSSIIITCWVQSVTTGIVQYQSHCVCSKNVCVFCGQVCALSVFELRWRSVMWLRMFPTIFLFRIYIFCDIIYLTLNNVT